MVLYLDHYDSFTNTIVDYINYLNFEVDIKKTDQDIDNIEQYSHIIIGPGPGHPNELKKHYKIIEYCEQSDIPLLGICLGHQLIAQYYGANIIKAKNIFHGRNSTLIKLHDSNLYKSFSQNFEVTRYHSLIVDKLLYPLEVIAITDDNEIMAFQHQNKKIYGVQYHPEAYLTEKGLETLNNFLNI
jgi:anthranilate synthase component 2